MTRRYAILVCLIIWGALLPAQDTSLARPPVPESNPVIHWGKWVTLGAAVGFTIAAVVQHNHAQDSWNQLLVLCGANNQACMLGSDGRYLSYEAEYLYEQTVYYDHLARHRIVVGQVSLLASVGMFVMEFKRRQLAPPNIPLHGLEVLIQPAADGRAQLGFTLPF